jgi:dihydrofolate synthase/folylpolyglutamate synthase
VNHTEALEWLYATQLHGVKLGLENMRRLAGALGIRLDGGKAPRFLHVAGTNGKGSVCAMLDAICRAHGYSTGLFTSPHLVTFRERIRVNGRMISEAAVAAILSEIRDLTTGWDHSPTFFEITTALALLHFQREGVDLVVLETGMGGRLDATNVVTPLASIVTEIDLDHQQWLGDTLARIAFEKAGIIKSGIPAISAPQQEEAQLVISHLAYERDCAFHLVCSPLENLPIALPGSHQRWNAALAVHALEVAGVEIDQVAIASGLRNVEWEGRFQRIDARTVLDGAHNPAAARNLVRTWKEIFQDHRATVILGVLKDKDVVGVCSTIASIAARIIAVPVANPRSSTVEEVCDAVRHTWPELACTEAPDLAAALQLARESEEPILIAGSLFLVGEALTLLSPQAPYEISAQ